MSIKQSLTVGGTINSIFQDVPDEVVVFIKGGKVVMPATMYPDECDLSWVDLL